MAGFGTKRQRKVLVTFVIAGAGAILTEHMLKPTLKKKLKI
jgi:hypothetical protein